MTGQACLHRLVEQVLDLPRVDVEGLGADEPCGPFNSPEPIDIAVAVKDALHVALDGALESEAETLSVEADVFLARFLEQLPGALDIDLLGLEGPA